MTENACLWLRHEKLPLRDLIHKAAAFRYRFLLLFLLYTDSICSHQNSIRCHTVHVHGTTGSIGYRIEIIHLAVNGLPSRHHPAAGSIGNRIEIIDSSIHICKPSRLHIAIGIKMVPLYLAIPGQLLPAIYCIWPLIGFEFPSQAVRYPAPLGMPSTGLSS